MPSTNYITLSTTLTSYTAPADGYLTVGVQGSTGAYALIRHNAMGATAYGINSVSGYTFGIMPMEKGGTANIDWNGAISERLLRFILARNS